MLENTEGAIKNGQSIETGSKEYSRYFLSCSVLCLKLTIVSVSMLLNL